MDTLVLTVPRTSIKEFILNDLVQLVVHMHQVSGKFFLPTSLTASVNRPEEDLMILMRNTTKINERNGPFVIKSLTSPPDVARVCQNYTIRSVKLKPNASDAEQVSAKIVSEVNKLLGISNLKLLGGFQSSETEYELFLFK